MYIHIFMYIYLCIYMYMYIYINIYLRSYTNTGIFIGAEDIRMQLPEEAKKFDLIDKTFKGIIYMYVY
jgi:hypothetical protein